MSGVKRQAGATDLKPSKKVKTGEKKSSAPPFKSRDGKPNFKKTKPDFNKAEDVNGQKNKTEEIYNTKSSKEAHAKQRAVAKERKLAKPNADSIQRAKQLWERLRIKSAVKPDERKTLVDELFTIVTGRVKEFVFKHDSVRTIQCALKYASKEQRKQIARELKGSYKELAESRYAKFLVGKILVSPDDDIREMIISEFYGSVRRMINHPEASWILDDTYRQIASKKQKATLLREWYGTEFSVFKSGDKDELTADLLKILETTPEKRQPIMQYLHGLINQLIQKKMHGFTMLHDAMLQYSLAISTPKSLTAEDIASTAASTAHQEWLELLKPTEEADFDLLRNLAFTASGARVVGRALALSSAKDRKLLLRPYKDHIETLACDNAGISVLLATYESVDDTVMVGKLLFPELLATKIVDPTERADNIAALAVHPTGRLSLLWVLTNSDARWPGSLTKADSAIGSIVREVRSLRAASSKKAPEQRRLELGKGVIAASDGAVLEMLGTHAKQLALDSFGSQFVAEALLTAEAAQIGSKNAQDALTALASGDPADEGHMAQNASACRLLKTLIQRGRYDPESKTVEKIAGPSDGLTLFPTLLWEQISAHAEKWATGEGSFVIVALCEDNDFTGRQEVISALQGMKSALQSAAADQGEKRGNKGAKILLELI